MKFKATMAPHGNEYDMVNELTKDCATWSPTGLRILESIVGLLKRTIAKIDAKTAFLQTGKADRMVFVIHPSEIEMKCTHLRLLIAAAYGLVNDNAKWQAKTDNKLH